MAPLMLEAEAALLLRFSHAMSQLPQDEFETSLEKAEAWMKEIHERLKENDNTQGPRSALESRLRETEKICALEGDGKLLIDKVLMKAEILLGESSEEEKHEIHLKLAKIKGLFEETTTYMIHCHSRIEWVWLHWNEYLKARDEFTLWVHNITLTLEPDVELQLGLKEKRWQYEQAMVLMKDVLNQSRLLDRLLEEASSLYNRIGDPSVDESVQSAMMAEYIQIKKKAQERVEHLEKTWKDHEAYNGDINGFKSWLNSVIEKLKLYVGAASNSTENRLDILQDISKDVESGNKQLDALEVKSAQVIKNTSPLGAEKICKELEELRNTLKELKQMNDEEEETLLKTHDSENAFLLLARQLEANINEFRKATQRLEESLESGERVKSEDDLIALWTTLNATKSALAAEEAKAERVKVQLRDLFKFSKDVQPLSDGVISAMRDYQRAKSKAFKLSIDTESELKQLFQNPLREFLYWKPIAERVLDATALPVNDGGMNDDALDNIETLLEKSFAIKDMLAALEKKKERIQLVLGEDKARTLLQDIVAAEKEREEIHQELLQRKKGIQSLAERKKEFDSIFKTLHQKKAAIRVKSIKENELEPDIIGKEAQVQRLQTLLEELMGLYSPIQDLISMTKSQSTDAHRAEQLNSDYVMLQRSLENKVRKSKENINTHLMFNHHLRDLQNWILVTTQKLESCQNGGKNWDEKDIEALEAELTEKDMQRHLVEVQGKKVIDTSSPEGGALIQSELNQVAESWNSLLQLYEQMARLGKGREQHGSSPKSLQKPTDTSRDQTYSLVSDMDTDDFPQSNKTPTPNKTSISITQDDQGIHNNLLDDISTDDSQRNRGFRQIGGSSGLISDMDTDDFPQSNKTPTPNKTSISITQDDQGIHNNLLDDISTDDSQRNRGFRQIGGSSGLVSDMDTDDFPQINKTPTPNKTSIRISQDGQVINNNSPYDTGTDDSPRNRGFRQFGGSSGTGYNVVTNSITDLPDGLPGHNKSSLVLGHKGDSRRTGYNVVTNSVTDLPDGLPGHNKSSLVLGHKGDSRSNTHDIHSISGNDKTGRDPAGRKQDKSSSVRISGSGNGNNSPGTSKKSTHKSLAVKRIDAASSIDLSGYEFRVIDQEVGSQEDETSERAGSIDLSGYEFRVIDQEVGSQEDETSERPGSIDLSGYKFRVIDQEVGSQEDETSERPGSADADGHSFRSIGSPGSSKKNISSGRGFGQIEKRSGAQEVNGLGDSGEGDAQAHEVNGGSARFPSGGHRTTPSHTPSKSKSPSVVRGDLTSRTGLQQDDDLHHRSGLQISQGRLQVTSGSLAEENMNKGKSPNNPGRTRRNRKFLSLAESVDMVDSPSSQITGGGKDGDDHMTLLLEFEQWLQTESSKLNRICASHVSGSEEMKTRQRHLQNLQSRVPQGQRLFESLLRRSASMAVTENLKLEELRYLWMLYKSKLRDSGKNTNLTTTEELRGATKTGGGLCSFLHRVCCAALPLQLLLLLLLLLAFLLPLLQETKNCALSNNFARSFNLMLKYDGPPPT
ncbi:nesprin-3 isoform X2 [Hyla sarda]|uniref:nesprin-3 isoform X2 n=1 Tax=Hyla sarda TaxID=327740 RepID=UPI0024C39BC7|nr:nesprin-3 isoform X2 [Hyla sarda]